MNHKIAALIAWTLFILSCASGWAQVAPSAASAKSATTQASAPPAATLPPNPLKVAQLHWYLANLSVKFPAGNQPIGLCFDGSNIWAANFGNNTVSKLRAADGALLGTFKVGYEPYGVTFDGTDIWVSNSGDGTVTKLRASDGTVLGTFTVGGGPGWMALRRAKYLGAERRGYRGEGPGERWQSPRHFHGGLWGNRSGV